MKKVLYLISRQPTPEVQELLRSSHASGQTISGLGIQQGIDLESEWPFPFYVLENDIDSKNSSVSCPKVTYSDMLEMIFDADTIISM